MDAQKYVIRKLIGLPGASIRIVLEKAKSRAFLVPFCITLAIALVILSYVAFILEGEERDKLIGAIISGLMWGGVYAIIALGIVVVYKATRIFNMAHGGILLFLAYTTWWLMAPDRQDLDNWLALILVACAAIVTGLVIDRLIFRRMIGSPPLVTFMLSLFLGFIFLHGFTQLIFEGKSQIMPKIFPDGTIPVGNYNLPYDLLFGFIVATAMFLIFVFYFRFTKSGLAMRCVSEDSVLSQSLGIDVKKIYSIAWVVGCLAAAVGGVLIGTKTAVYSESGGMGVYALYRALPIVILGGLESIPGAYIAALMVGLLESLSGSYIDPHVPQFRAVLPYLLVIAIMIVRPHGLFGLKGIRRI